MCLACVPPTPPWWQKVMCSTSAGSWWSLWLSASQQTAVASSPTEVLPSHLSHHTLPNYFISQWVMQKFVYSSTTCLFPLPPLSPPTYKIRIHTKCQHITPIPHVNLQCFISCNILDGFPAVKNYIVSNGRLIDEWWIWKNLDESGHGLKEGLSYGWTDTTQQKITVRRTDDTNKIQTRHLPNKK
jgi:hypothetical protein